jgi:hypothetical protein
LENGRKGGIILFKLGEILLGVRGDLVRRRGDLVRKLQCQVEDFDVIL